jgi:hypothetical protein
VRVLGGELATAQRGIGDHVVEALHHRRLIERGQRRQLDGASCRGEALAVVGRVGAGVVEQRGEPVLPQPGDRRARGTPLSTARGRALIQ